MAPPSGLSYSTIPSEPETAFPPLVRSSTVPVSLGAHHNGSLSNLNHHSQHQFHRADPSHLAPEDAFTAASPPRRLSSFDHLGNGSGGEMRPRRVRRKDGASRSRSRRRKRFQKLLWVKQSCMTSYTELPAYTQ
jgi:phosphatidylinositol glycan class C protein